MHTLYIQKIEHMKIIEKWQLNQKINMLIAEAVACLHPFQKFSIFNIIKLHPALH